MAALGSMDADTGGKVLAKVLAFYALLNLAIECTGLAIFLAIDPGASVNLETKNQTEQSETLPLRFACNPMLLGILMEMSFKKKCNGCGEKKCQNFLLLDIEHS